MKTILVLFLLSIVPVSARIGEDRWQLRARYGRELNDFTNTKGNGTMNFEKNKLSIRAYLKAGKTVWITFQPTTLRRQELDFATACLLVEANQGETKMELIEADTEQGIYIWEDKAKKLRASYNKERMIDMLVIGLTEALDGSNDEKTKMPEKPHVKGF